MSFYFELVLLHGLEHAQEALLKIQMTVLWLLLLADGQNGRCQLLSREFVRVYQVLVGHESQWMIEDLRDLGVTVGSIKIVQQERR